MDEWDPQKMLDLYIHDYLVRKNMHTTAEILAKEADIQPKPVVINPPEGFLAEWWHLFWDVYNSRIEKERQGDQGSTSQATLSTGPGPQSAPPAPPMPDANYMAQNAGPSTLRPVNLPAVSRQEAGPSTPRPVNLPAVSRQEVGNLMNAFPPEMVILMQNSFPPEMRMQNAPSLDMRSSMQSPPAFPPEMRSFMQNAPPEMRTLMQNAPPEMRSLMHSAFPSEMGSLMQNTPPQMGTSMPNVGPSEMRSLPQNVPPMKPDMGFGPNSFGPTPISDHNMRQGQIMANLFAQNMQEQEHLRLPVPPRNPDPRFNALCVKELAGVLPSTSSSSYRRRRASNTRQLPVTREVNIGAGLQRFAAMELSPPEPRVDPNNANNANSGRKELNKDPSEGFSLSGFGYANNFPVPNQHKQFPAPSEGCQADSIHELAAQASGKLIISSDGSSAKMVGPTLIGDSSKGKGLQIEDNTEMEKPMDEDIESFFSTDETPENLNNSFTHTLPQSSAALKQKAQQEFPLAPSRSYHPTNNKLLCCDFSSEGKFLAAAGHEKKVFVWNLKKPNRQTINAHSQIITDVRFKPNSTMFATCSFDKTVKIWDAANSKKSLHTLGEHEDQVTSVDFHPRMPNLVCSCDSSDEIKLWNINEATCYRTLKGAKTQVRFQPRQGNLLAASTGNMINIINVETGTIQYRFEGHEKEVRSMCWNVSGEYLVTTSPDKVRIWSILAGGTCIHELNSCGGNFASCTFHPAYSLVVAIGSYQMIHIWNPAMGNKTWDFHSHQGIVSSMASSPETYQMASVSHDQWVKLWK